jgi:hypothetical protein
MVQMKSGSPILHGHTELFESFPTMFEENILLLIEKNLLANFTPLAQG